MRCMPGLLGALLVLAPLAGASSLLGPNLCGQLRNRQLELLNELLSPLCQNDGNSGGDAPDTCPANQTFQPFLPKGSAQEGILLPVGDLKDHWLAFVSGRGELLTITMDPAPTLPNSNLLPPDFDVAALTMGCQDIRPVQGGPQQGNLRETIVVPTPFGAP